MGPKTKKAPKNAFSFFLDEYVEKERARGRKVSHKIAAEECGSAWQALSEENKQKYNQLAEDHKAFQKVDRTKKFTSTGISYAQLDREREELKKKVEREDNEIKMTISHLDSETLKTHLFYIIHCNYYCKTSDGVYVPGELAIAEFNLEDGVRRTFHTLINPGSIPLGYAFEAKQTIEEVHGLPYPPYEEGDSDYFGILEKILNFIEDGKLPDGRYPPFYCIENNIKASEYILQVLSDSLNEEGENFFRVFLLHKMFFFLKNKCVEYNDEENVGFPVMSNAESEVDKDVFCYSPGISCSFHLTSDALFHNCSLSIVQRYVFLICDHCCQYVDVEIIPGKHSRLKCDTDRRATRAKLEAAARARAASEAEYEGLSSYADDASAFDWRKDDAGSFLHEEIESKFSGCDVSSVASRSTRNVSTPTYRAPSVSTRGEEETNVEEEEDTDEEDFKKYLSVGRGSMRF